MDMLAEVLETLMIVSFGISWPLNLYKAIKSRSAKGKSILFNYFIGAGYICGILSKAISHTYNLAFWFYFPNLIMVTADIFLYYRNCKLDRLAEKQQ